MEFLLFFIYIISFTFDVLLLFDDSESSKEMIVLVYLVLVAPEHSDEWPILPFFSVLYPRIPDDVKTLVR